MRRCGAPHECAGAKTEKSFKSAGAPMPLSKGGNGDGIRDALTFSVYGKLWRACPASSSPTFPSAATGDRRCSRTQAITRFIAIFWPSDGIACWAYCLMPNHVHLILTPARADGLSRAVGEAHRRFTGYVNARARETGHLFQGRFGCVAMDETHCLNAVRYLAFNPVRARLSAAPGDWPWSSVRAHLGGRDDALVSVRPLLELAPNCWRSRWTNSRSWRVLQPAARTGARWATRSSSLSSSASWAALCVGESPGPSQSMSRAETGIVYHVPVYPRRPSRGVGTLRRPACWSGRRGS